jgi:hypothetical protein
MKDINHTRQLYESPTHVVEKMVETQPETASRETKDTTLSNEDESSKLPTFLAHSTRLILPSVHHAAPIVTFPLILTQGANRLTKDAQPASATAIKNTALKPSM